MKKGDLLHAMALFVESRFIRIIWRVPKCSITVNPFRSTQSTMYRVRIPFHVKLETFFLSFAV